MRYYVSFLLIWSNLCFGQDILEKIEIEQISDRVYIHTTYGKVGDAIYPANGVFIVGDKGIILVDTPWNKDQTKQLLNRIEKEYKKPIKQFIPTHYHRDRMGGIEVILEQNIPVVISKKTFSLAKEEYDLSKIKTQNYIRKKMKVSIDNVSLQIYYPGHGHTIDNLVVYLPKEQILFGGCIIKSEEAQSLGYIQEADLKKWKKALENIQNDFKHIRYVIPGHGQTGETTLIMHTFDLLNDKLEN